MPITRSNTRTRPLSSRDRRLMVSAYLRKRFGPQVAPHGAAALNTPHEQIAAGYVRKRQGAAATRLGAA